MKTLNILIFGLFIFFNISCSENSIVDVKSSKSSGNLSLKIDKANAPSDVVLVTATLTGEDYASITANMNLLTDTNAEFTFNKIPVGVWHLTVEAKNNDNVVLYSGQSEVTVFENNITNINITLSPVVIGSGTIQINVNWGDSEPNLWQDYNLNPVLTYTDSYYDYYGVQQPKLLYEDGIYKMWYLGLAGSSRSHVCYAESQDGLNWTTPVQNPVMFPGNYGSWDATAAIAGAVIKEDNVYKMYYVGWNDQYSNWHIGLATSVDGISWTKLPVPVIYGTSGWEYQIIPSTVLKIDGVYYLYYYGRNYPQARIGLAFSYDGINWTKYSGNPILTPTEAWEGQGVYHPSVIKEGNIFRMVYSCTPANAFGLATSSDGKNWIKQTSNPFFRTNDTYNQWANESIAYPFFTKVNDQYLIYYSGFSSSGPMNKYKIGVIRR
ncbi:MAG: hypothetical protein R6W90_06110 [Ignavibacteriaceae bacterium]